MTLHPILLAQAIVNSAVPAAPPPEPSPAPAATRPRAQPAPIAVDPAIVAHYSACTALAARSPEAAITSANAWRVEGGTFYARQCLGLAYSTLERWEPAATVFEQAAREAAAARDARSADFWVQSGNAWVAAGEPTRAVQAFDAALATINLTDELRGEVHLDRARALVELGNAAGARADVDRALRLVERDPFAWYLSAALARRSNEGSRAQGDIARAVSLAGDNPDILLLAGTIAGEAGNMIEAERLYQLVAEGAPETDAGRQARESLATLREVEVPAPPQPAPTPR